MQKIILLILGILLIGIAPVFVTALFQKKNKYFDKEKNRSNCIYLIILSNLFIFFLLNNNSDILFGTFIGSSLFQLLAVGGVGQLFYRIDNYEKSIIPKGTGSSLFYEKRGKVDGRGQYLVFCMILLLFLSADYLLTGNAANNVLSRMDGALLIFLFLLYIFIRLRNDLEIHFPEKTDCFYFISLEAVILPGAYLFVQNIPKIGASLGLSQYLIGVTVVSWCVNIATVLLTKEQKQEINHLEKIMEETVITVTLLLGGVVCILPLSVSSYMVYDMILFGVISVVLQFIQKIDNRLAASSMATVYIAFIVYVFVR